MKKKKRLSKLCKREENDVPPEQLSLVWRIIVLLFIAACIYYLYRTGGNGNDWYPGKPIQTR